MTSKEIFDSYIQGSGFIEEFIKVLADNKASYCVIGGVAVNAYAEPLYSEDLDLVVAAKAIPGVIEGMKKKFTVKQLKGKYILTKPNSKLIINIITDERYQSFIAGAEWQKVFDLVMPIVNIADLFQAEIWAAAYPDRPLTKQLKDKTDIARLLEVKPELKNKLPESLKELLPRKKDKGKEL